MADQLNPDKQYYDEQYAAARAQWQTNCEMFGIDDAQVTLWDEYANCKHEMKTERDRNIKWLHYIRSCALWSLFDKQCNEQIDTFRTSDIMTR